jgi:hypothetical protein
MISLPVRFSTLMKASGLNLVKKTKGNLLQGNMIKINKGATLPRPKSIATICIKESISMEVNYHV